MKAMVFAAGLGTRLRPITDMRPKALVEVGGEPMLGHVIRKLISSGIDEIVVNVHHFADMVCDYISANGNFGVKIYISDERNLLLDTGGGILRAASFLAEGREPFVVHNTDILTDFDLGAMIENHRQHDGVMASLLVSERKTSRYLCFGKNDGQLCGWVNTKTGEVRPDGFTRERAATSNCLAFGGVHVMSPEVFPLLASYAASHGEVFSIIPFYLQICRGAEIQAYYPKESYNWYDIGRLETLEAACRWYAGNAD